MGAVNLGPFAKSKGIGSHNTMFLKGFEPPCRLTGRHFQKGDYVVQFPALPIDRDDPLWDYNEWPMLREAFDKWENREAFLVHWEKFIRRNVARLRQVLIDRTDYLVLLGWTPPRVGLFFLRHGFSLFVPKQKWQAFRNFMLKGHQPTREFCLPDNMQVLVGIEGNKIRVTYEPLPTGKGRRDRVLLDQSEWRALEEILHEIDFALHEEDWVSETS
jgi:hypothetical protein